MPIPHPDGEYALTRMYSVADDAWYLELELAHGPKQEALVVAVVPDEDPAREPTVWFSPRAGDQDVPFEVMRWFMDEVEAEIRHARAWMRLRPELVDVVHRLRQEYLGAIDDADFPHVLAQVRGAVPEEDVAVVLASAFGRKPDGTDV